MTDAEFDVLDELYFVTSFEKLQKSVGLPEEEVKTVLESLLQKGWVKCFYADTDEVVTDNRMLAQNYTAYHYLATKAGLLAHNSR